MMMTTICKIFVISFICYVVVTTNSTKNGLLLLSIIEATLVSGHSCYDLLISREEDAFIMAIPRPGMHLRYADLLVKKGQRHKGCIQGMPNPGSLFTCRGPKT
jgi:hypothetical protein